MKSKNSEENVFCRLFFLAVVACFSVMATLPLASAKLHQNKATNQQLQGMVQQLTLHSQLSEVEVKIAVDRAWKQFRTQAQYAQADRDLNARANEFQRLLMHEIQLIQQRFTRLN